MSTTPGQVVPGLEGVLAFESSIAYIDGSIPELSIRGYAIEDIVGKLGYEQLAFLLWHDRVPDEGELAAFRAELARLRAVPKPVLTLLKATPKSASPWRRWVLQSPCWGPWALTRVISVATTTCARPGALRPSFQPSWRPRPGLPQIWSPSLPTRASTIRPTTTTC